MPFYFVRGLPSVVMELLLSLCPRGNDELRAKIWGNLLTGWSETAHPRTNCYPLEKLVEVAYLLTLCSIPKWHTG